jgi:hypothetical protein
MKKAIFYIDGGNGYYCGYTNGQQWNGWAMPYLSKSEILRMLKVESIENEFKWVSDRLYETDVDRPIATPLVVESMLVDGELYYAVGNNWVWVDVWFDEDITLNVRDISGRGGVYNTTPLDYACANTQDTDLVQWLENNWTSGEYINEDMAEAITIVHTPTPINE